ncbi:GCN5-like 1 protein [Rutstroemia sp. NJR-2017a BBW]|nr:GCN5-like 1 protein [Rutstroemia sp. NJR-2017a BBW]
MSTSSLAPPPPQHGPSSSAGSSSSRPTSNISSSNPPSSSAPSDPSPESLRQLAQSRTFLQTTLQQILVPSERDLQVRAQTLHSNSAALSKQEDVLRKEIKGLGKENDKLQKVVREGQKKIMEVGNVQNWAEVLEREFAVLEEVDWLLGNGEGSVSGSGSEWSSDEEGGDERHEEREGEGEAGREDVGVESKADTNDDSAVERPAVDANGDTTMEDFNLTKHQEDESGKGKQIVMETEGEGSEHTENTGEDYSTSTNMSTTDPSTSSMHTLDSVSANVPANG